jgi:3-oxoacyl-[acyl-carrier protein] reductase
MEHKRVMNLDLQNKVFVVTGSSRGIGKAIAEGLLTEGASVGLLALNKSPLEGTISEFQAKFDSDCVEGWPVDCAEESALRIIRKQIISKWGRLDGVVANVGDGRSVPDMIPETKQWSKVWRTNFETTLNTARIFLPMLQDTKGCLLFISSITGLEVIGAPVDYSTAKTAVIAFAQNLACKAAPEVRVNVITPGNVYVPGGSWEENFEADSVKVKKMLQTSVPMKRFGTPKEIADAAVFLCSERAAFITGTVLRVDGGQIKGLL